MPLFLFLGISALSIGLFVDGSPVISVFNVGDQAAYKLETTVLVYNNDDHDTFGHKISADVTILTRWEDKQKNEKLLEILIASPEIKSSVSKRRKQTGDEFEKRRSKIEQISSCSFLVQWQNGSIANLLLPTEEDSSILNLKRGIASLLQFQVIDGLRHEEQDASGTCTVEYKRVNSAILNKRKLNCMSDTSHIRQHTEKIFGATVVSTRDINYELSEDLSVMRRVTSYESHKMKVNADENIHSTVTTVVDLVFISVVNKPKVILVANDVKEALEKAKVEATCKLMTRSIVAESGPVSSQVNSKKLHKLLSDREESLKEEMLGSLKSASGFLSMVKAVRNAKEDEIVKLVKNSHDKPIMKQLSDVLGAAQTIEAHRAIKTTVDFNKQKNLDVLERYLWALSMGCCPLEKVIRDLIEVWKDECKINKLQQTLALTFTSMVRKLGEKGKQLSDEVVQMLEENVSNCNDDDCILSNFRALQSLGNPKCKPLLLSHARSGSRIISTSALKVLYSLSPSNWDEEVLRTAEEIYYQKWQKYDSSARTFSADIILESDPDVTTLTAMIQFLESLDPAYEIKTYTLQRIMQLSSVDERFAAKVKQIMKSKNLNHYGVLAQKGMSNALTTTFFKYSDINASLSSVNEVSKSTIKRSVIDVNLVQYDHSYKALSLGLYASGLSTFMWSDMVEVSEEPDEPEKTTAGLELTILGTLIRPFTFFSGYGELVGHLWSGTASEMTTVMQVIALLHDHYQSVNLMSGETVNFQLEGASSFRLAGKVELSIWNRNGNSLVELKSGSLVRGSTTIESSFVSTLSQFTADMEVSLNFLSDLNFSTEILLCLQLNQPNFSLRYAQQRSLKVRGSRYSLKRRKEKKVPISGRTYAFSQKNKGMCNAIYAV